MNDRELEEEAVRLINVEGYTEHEVEYMLNAKFDIYRDHITLKAEIAKLIRRS